MVEVWLFGRLVATLASAFAVVLVLVALTSVTYLAMTLAPVLRLPGAPADRAARRLGISVAAGVLLAAALGLRVGAPGGGGELVPSIALAVAAAATLGSTAAFGALGGGRAALALGAAGARRRREIEGRKRGEAKRLVAAKRAFEEGDDLRAQLAEAEAAVARLRAALTNLGATRDEVEARLGRLDEAAAASDLGRELRRTRDEVAGKLELGGKILRAAEAAAFRIAAGAPVARLLRRRPRRVAEGVSGDAATPARLAEIAGAIDAFLERVKAARAELDALAARRPEHVTGDDDPLAQAQRDIDAVEEAYRAVRERLDVVRLRLAARADLDAVAGAAGEVSEKARASGLPAGDLQDLVDEVMRAEAAIVMATPGELDPKALSAALARGTAALDGRDGSSLDELLRALRELS
jgi:hypothetical protein